jgi:hypothetical protein
MTNRITDFVAHHKTPLIAGAALIVLAAYFLPLNSLTDTALAQKGGNENRFKVCEFPFDEDKPGNQDPPKKCYGNSVGSD